MLIRVLAGVAVVLVVAAVLLLAAAWRPAIAPVETPLSSSFSAGMVGRGARLAALGNCVSCHTASGGASLAGGRPIGTPFGVLYSTNITPDPDTGIGRWSQQAFARAMREGVSRGGTHLYPAFPYDHFRLMTDEDIAALYAYLMTREPVRAEPPKNDLPFPLNVRLLLAGWKMLFLDEDRYRPDGTRSAEWNSGAYLVQAVAHCSACHTPRNFLGARKDRRHLAGGESEGWHAPALNADSPAPVPWTAENLEAYLRFGSDRVHSAPAGPMQRVVESLADVPDEDLKAMAVYLASLQTRPAVELEKQAQQAIMRAREKNEAVPAPGASAGASTPANTPGGNGAAIYTSACASCHGVGRGEGGALQLALATSVHLDTPRNLIRIIRDGITPPEGRSGPWMPGFAGALTDEQLTVLVDYIRNHFGEKPAWRDVAGEVKALSGEER